MFWIERHFAYLAIHAWKFEIRIRQFFLLKIEIVRHP
jgi:hypothetical protein